VNSAARESTTPVVVDTDFKDHPLSSSYQTILAGRSLTVSLVTLAEGQTDLVSRRLDCSRRLAAAALQPISRW
jgi:hypothetical protein